MERRAYKQAMFAIREEQGALDVVQDAMLKLTEKYSEKPLSFEGLKTVPIDERGGKVQVQHFAKPYKKGAGVALFS